MAVLAVLEDNYERVAAMRVALEEHKIDLSLEVFPTAPKYIEWMRTHSAEVKLISLDHDLEPEEGSKEDPGTGRDVANWLAEQEIKLPTILHSSNAQAVEGMKFVLKDSGIKTYRVAPYEDLTWVGEKWIETIKKLVTPKQ